MTMWRAALRYEISAGAGMTTQPIQKRPRPCGRGPSRNRCPGGSEFLLALVERLVMLDAGDAQAGHAGAIHGALPAGKLLERQAVALARLVDRQQPAIDRGDHLGLATYDPAGRRAWRQAVQRQRLPEGADHAIRPYFLVLDH